MKEQLQNELADLIAKQSEAHEAYVQTTVLVKQKQIELYQFETGLNTGDKVQFKDGRQLKTGEVTGFKVQYGSPTVIVAEHKKDGTIGKRTRDYFYGGEVTKIN